MCGAVCPWPEVLRLELTCRPLQINQEVAESNVYTMSLTFASRGIWSKLTSIDQTEVQDETQLVEARIQRPRRAEDSKRGSNAFT